MIIHYNHDKPVHVYVVNSRLPVYCAYYEDSLGDTISGLFTRMAPKVAKQLSMKAIDVIRDKGISAAWDVAGMAFSAARNKLMSLVRRKKQPPLRSTTVMPANVSKVINNAVETKLSSLIALPSTESSLMASPLATPMTPSMMTPSLATQSLATPMTPPMATASTSTKALMNAIAGSGLKPKRRRRWFSLN